MLFVSVRIRFTFCSSNQFKSIGLLDSALANLLYRSLRRHHAGTWQFEQFAKCNITRFGRRWPTVARQKLFRLVVGHLFAIAEDTGLEYDQTRIGLARFNADRRLVFVAIIVFVHFFFRFTGRQFRCIQSKLVGPTSSAVVAATVAGHASQSVLSVAANASSDATAISITFDQRIQRIFSSTRPVLLFAVSAIERNFEFDCSAASDRCRLVSTSSYLFNGTFGLCIETVELFSKQR